MEIGLTTLREVRVNYAGETKALESILSPEGIAKFVRRTLTCDTKEHVFAIYLNSANEIIGYSVVSIGLVSTSLVHPREVFQPAILLGATRVILAHNHPTGMTTPSIEDRMITEQLRDAGKLLGISLLDHIIVGNPGEYSFKESSNVLN